MQQTITQLVSFIPKRKKSSIKIVFPKNNYYICSRINQIN